MHIIAKIMKSSTYYMYHCRTNNNFNKTYSLKTDFTAERTIVFKTYDTLRNKINYTKNSDCIVCTPLKNIILTTSE